MKQGLLVGAVIASRVVAAVASEPTTAYHQAERSYERVISTFLQGGLCVAGTDRALEAQRDLANAVEGLAPTAGERVLLFAVTANRPDVVRRLLVDGAPRVGDNGSLLHAAVRFGGAPLLETLTKAGFGLEDHGGSSGSALFAAVESNRPENVDWLVRHGADVNAVDTAGAPVLRHALVCRNQDVIRNLIAAGARIDEETRALAERRGVELR